MPRGKKNDLNHFMSLVEINENGCWLWQGADRDSHGKYGRTRFRGTTWMVHRAVWTLIRGEIPDGMTLDHLCFTMLCVNPDHLEVVTGLENYMRWANARTHCQRGHPFNDLNTRVIRTPIRSWRQCRTCRSASRQAQTDRNRAFRRAATATEAGA